MTTVNWRHFLNLSAYRGYQIDTKDAFEALPDSGKLILSYVAQNGKANRYDLTKHMKWDTAQVAMKNLSRIGLLEVISKQPFKKNPAQSVITYSLTSWGIVMALQYPDYFHDEEKTNLLSEWKATFQGIRKHHGEVLPRLFSFIEALLQLRVEYDIVHLQGLLHYGLAVPFTPKKSVDMNEMDLQLLNKLVESYVGNFSYHVAINDKQIPELIKPLTKCKEIALKQVDEDARRHYRFLQIMVETKKYLEKI